MSAKIKICFIANNTNFSGAARSLWQILRYINKSKFESIVIVNKAEKGIYKLTPYAACYTFGIKKIRYRYTFRVRKFLSYLFEKRWFISRIRKFNPDIIYFNTNAAVKYMQWTKQAGLSAKIICHIHGQNEGLTYRMMMPEGNIPLDKDWIETTRNVPDHYIACACASRDVLIKNLHIFPNKITVAHESIDIQEIREYKGGITKQELGWEDKCIIGITASFNYRKGADILIESARVLCQQNENLLFVWLGSDVDRMDKSYSSGFAIACTEKIREYGLQKHICLMGHEPDIYKYMKLFDVFALPTRDECLPLSILEAMFLRIPIVATSVSGIPEVLNNINGILTEPTPESFAQGIRSALIDIENNDTSKIEMARKDVDNFDVRIQVEKIEACINKLLTR